MQASHPHYLLFSEGTIDDRSAPTWKFALKSVDAEDHFSASDTECESRASRLELLAVVRGLEALAQPSRVTLLTRSRYVRRGIRRELNQWRDRRWRWERFGKLVPIRDCDLWQRVDRALKFHQVECCAWTDDNAEKSAGRTAGCGSAQRGRRRSANCTSNGWNMAGVLSGLRRSVVNPISSLWRPPFTRAA